MSSVEFSADGQAQTCAAIPACGGDIDLAERFKEPFGIFRSNADASVGNAEVKKQAIICSGIAALCLITFFDFHRCYDLTLRCKFDGVGE